jgi:predicted TIM-barrel fold metal-dependent hydrolase
MSTVQMDDLDQSNPEPDAALPLKRVYTPLVDTHAHIYHRGLPLSDTAWHRPPSDAPLECFLEALDTAGVRYAVLAAASIYGDYNDYQLDAARGSDRLKTTVIVNPEIDVPALRRMDADGACGIRLQFRNVSQPPDLWSDEYQTLFKRVADLGWHIQLHDEGQRLPLYLDAIANAGPDLIVDHLGRPPLKKGISSEGFRALLAAVEQGRTWVKLSAAFRAATPELAKAAATMLLDHAGTDRLMWGSDWPFAAYEDSMTYAKAIDQYVELVPDPQIRRRIDLTAMRLFFPDEALET